MEKEIKWDGGSEMTDEERQKLVYRLRQTAIVRDVVGSEAADAANEIERLMKELKEANTRTFLVESTLTKIKNDIRIHLQIWSD